MGSGGADAAAAAAGMPVEYAPLTDAPLKGLSPGQAALARALVTLGLQIVHEERGPMRLWDFARRLRGRLRMAPVPLAEWCDAVKATLARIDHPRLRLLAPGMTGVGYVYDAADPDSVPIRSSR